MGEQNDRGATPTISKNATKPTAQTHTKRIMRKWRRKSRESKLFAFERCVVRTTERIWQTRVEKKDVSVAHSEV